MLTTIPPVRVPTVAYELLPAWALLVFVGAPIGLTTIRVILPLVVTQVIRLRASARITSSEHALRVLEIEDLPRPQREPKLSSAAKSSASRGLVARRGNS